MSVELAADVLRKLHYLGRQVDNIASTVVWFGGKRWALLGSAIVRKERVADTLQDYHEEVGEESGRPVQYSQRAVGELRLESVRRQCNESAGWRDQDIAGAFAASVKNLFRITNLVFSEASGCCSYS